MDLVIDRREHDVIYVDRANLHNADSKEIVNFTIDDTFDSVSAYVKVLAGFYNLNETECAVLKVIIYSDGAKSLARTLNKVSKLINKSNTTVNRAINNLRSLNLIYINEDNVVNLSSAINISKDKLDSSKFFIIEVNPKLTSKNINI